MINFLLDAFYEIFNFIMQILYFIWFCAMHIIKLTLLYVLYAIGAVVAMIILFGPIYLLGKIFN